MRCSISSRHRAQVSIQTSSKTVMHIPRHLLIFCQRSKRINDLHKLQVKYSWKLNAYQSAKNEIYLHQGTKLLQILTLEKLYACINST
jgi:hypothetical protein